MPKASHRVELLEGSVVKRFADPEAYFRELGVYKLGLEMTPRLIDFREPEWIRLERVCGLPYLDCPLDTCTVGLLARTIASFHLSTRNGQNCLCHWDNQPRNILLGNGRFHFVDFSDSRLARPEDDLTHLLLFWAGEFSADRMETLAAEFIAAYRTIQPLDPLQWKNSLANSILRFDQRRAQHQRAAQHVAPEISETNRGMIAGLLRGYIFGF